MNLANALASIEKLSEARDVFSLTEFELMELLDVDLAVVTSALAHISEITCPPYQTMQIHSSPCSSVTLGTVIVGTAWSNENMGGHLPTSLKGLDNALCGGIPFGVVTKLAGQAGIGKTQFCLKLSLLASLPSSYGGLDGSVIYIDTKSKFSSRRMIKIGFNSFPEVFHAEGMAQEMAGRILVLRPTSLPEFTESLQKIKVSLFQNSVKLLIIDSMAALLSGEGVQGPRRQHSLGWHISFIRSVAEFSRIPVVVTNQVTSQSCDETSHYSFQEQSRGETPEAATKLDSHLVAALGIHWAHAVSIRLIFESRSGQKFIKLAKSPLSPPLVFPFSITSSGIILLNDDGVEMPGPEMHSISCNNNVINFGSEMIN
ncbi:unnamed protein product [Withania somnifera]